MKQTGQQKQYIRLLSFCLLLLTVSANAQTPFLQGAAQQLQRLLPANTASKAAEEPVSPEAAIKQLQEQNHQIEEEIKTLRKELLSLKSEQSSLVPPKNKKALLNKLDEIRVLIEEWEQKKELSEVVSLELNRERLSLQQEKRRFQENTTSGSNLEKETLDLREQNLTLKVRFAEHFQSLATNKINQLSQQLDILEAQKKPTSHKEPLSEPASAELYDGLYQLPDTSMLRQRLSQVRKDLIQLQNLHYEVKYQLDQIQNMELLYELMLRQKQRLQAVILEQSASQIQQELKLKRYLLLEEKAISASEPESGEKQERINQTLDQLEQQLRLVRELKNLEAQLSANQQDMVLLLDQRQLWMATAPTLTPGEFASMIASLLRQVQKLGEIGVSKVTDNRWLFLVLLPLLWLHRELGRKSRQWLVGMDDPTELTMAHWVRQLLVLLIRPAPFCLLLVLLMQFKSQQGAARELQYGLLIMSYGWLILLDACRRKGLVSRWLTRSDNANIWAWPLAGFSLTALWLAALSFQWFENPFENRIAPFILMLCSLGQIVTVWRWQSDFTLHDWRGMTLRMLWLSLLLLCVLTTATGYTQLSWLIFSQTQLLVLSGGFLWLLYLLADKGMKVRASRLAIRKAIELRQDEKSPPTSQQALKSSKQTVKALEHQGRTILSLLFTLLTLLVLTLIWNKVGPMLSPVSETRLFSFSQEQGSLTVVLGAVFNVIMLLFLTWVIAHNLPGFLLMALPQDVTQKPASVYIINKLLGYLLWAVGIALAFGQIGLPWEKLQWIILAISVGIGLGLQDIVANFFSGLIILIERPFRVGDTVTVNNIHGTVRHISVRATVIEDFDRKELIVPNKTLITGQLTNWSLNSNVLRVQLWYGVKHGCDNALVFNLLFQAAEESAKVLKKPPPEVYFIEYTEHAERYELRIFVNHVDDRFPAKNQVNQRVKELFREHGVEVAHMQHDLNLVSCKTEIDKNGQAVK